MTHPKSRYSPEGITRDQEAQVLRRVLNSVPDHIDYACAVWGASAAMLALRKVLTRVDGCSCMACRALDLGSAFAMMHVCPYCGDKRCAGAGDHRQARCQPSENTASATGSSS